MMLSWLICPLSLLRTVSKRYFPHSIVATCLCGGVDEAENVVVDKVATSAVGQKLKCLRVGHGPLLLVDLC